MAKIVWDAAGERNYEIGVDRGVLYKKVSGAYPIGVAWNGLISVSEAPSGAEATPVYADNIKYLNLISPEEFGATIEAYSYPSEFGECDGSKAVVEGMNFNQQARTPFGLCYRTKVGNDIDGTDGPTAGYKIHIIYGATAAPSEKAYASINDSVEPITFSWELTTIAESAGSDDTLRPVASVVIDSTVVDSDKLSALEDILYGTDSGTGTDEPRLPLPAELITLLSAS